MPNRLMPNMGQAGDYAGTLHYLKAANAIGAARAQKDGAAVVAQMKAMPTDDECFGKRRIRADGCSSPTATVPGQEAVGEQDAVGLL